ncbi:replicative DNA helicase [Saccharicrinis sp. FJH2]|uniref:replicative DNA helicase n=1 Tax=unclassified Saccharicrinis TaxID=2646859 RepID=UPI0035D49038
MAQKNTRSAQYKPTVPANEFGKLPPQAIELEEAVLGALMLEKSAYPAVGDILRTDSFYKEAHQIIYSAVVDLFSKEEPIDLLTVTEQLKKKGQLEEIGGPVYISQLTTKVASAAHIEYHARIIAQKYLQRELIRVSTEIQNNAYDESLDVDELLESAENSIFEISQVGVKNETTQINPIIEEAIHNIEEASKQKEGLSGVPSGFRKLDKITSGWQNSDLIILAARPAMGKTAFILSMTRNIALDFDRPIAIFSLEMSNVQLVNRLISSECEIEGEKIKNGRLSHEEWDHLNHKIKNLQDAPIFVDDTPGLSIFELRAKCRRLKQKHNISAIFIDYLQLMNAKDMKPGSREQEVSLISRSLKGLAKELNVPIVALSQLNRGVEGRTGYEGKRPQLADLRESGAIEQDADMVLFIHRPEYYGITEDPDGNDLIGVAEVIIAKHRNGATGTVQIRFRKELAKFIDPEDDFTGNYPGAGEPITLSSKMNSYEDEFNSQSNDFNRSGGGDSRPF